MSRSYILFPLVACMVVAGQVYFCRVSECCSTVIKKLLGRSFGGENVKFLRYDRFTFVSALLLPSTIFKNVDNLL
jgi:hypothetical protein